jgi:alkylation response protein AidB-like acyl-CoA dehydrogenase
VFTSGANQADYVWLACRTDPDAPKHKGISMIIVPTAAPGFKCTPIVTVGDVVTTATYYDDVRVPQDNVVGDVNAGWRLITNQLNHERVGLAALGGLTHRLWGDMERWCRETDSGSGDGTKMIDLPWVQMDLARTHARLEAMKLLNWKMAAAVGDETLSPADSSAVKVYGTECLIDVYRTLLGILGPVGYIADGSPGAVLRGEVERAARAAQINTFGGGVNEVQREIVAAVGLGMARTAR